MNLKMFALTGTIGGIVLALSVHHGRQFFQSREQISDYHQEMMLAVQQPLEFGEDPAKLYPDGGLPLDATAEPGYPDEPGSMRPSIQFKDQLPPLPPVSNSHFLILKKTSQTVPKTKDPI